MDYKKLHEEITNEVLLDEQKTIDAEAKKKSEERLKMREGEEKPEVKAKPEEKEEEAKPKQEAKETGLTSEDLDIQLEAYLIKKEGFEDINEKVMAFIEAIKAKLDEANSDALKEEVGAMWTSYRSFVKQMEEASQAKNASEELIAAAKKEFEGKIPKDVNSKSDAAEKELKEEDKEKKAKKEKEASAKKD